MFVVAFGSLTYIKIFILPALLGLNNEQSLIYKFTVLMGNDCPFGRDALIVKRKGPAKVVV